MYPDTKDEEPSDTPLADTVDDGLPEPDDAVEENKETGEPGGGNFA
ncbi:hypothetical protein [Sphingomonas montanisoli]|nr:hypothetical protein [Sphingomonas montanisoli]